MRDGGRNPRADWPPPEAVHGRRLRGLMPGDLGTVVDVDNAGQLLFESDSGSRLSLIPGRDRRLELPPGRTFEEDAL